jgi:hypothetical protein
MHGNRTHVSMATEAQANHSRSMITLVQQINGIAHAQ